MKQSKTKTDQAKPNKVRVTKRIRITNADKNPGYYRKNEGRSPKKGNEKNSD